MTIASIGSLGAAGLKLAATSIALTTTAPASAGDLVIVVVAKDNASATNGETNEIIAVADSAGNAFTKTREHCAAGGAADSGATCALYYCRLTNTLPSGGTITAQFSDARSASALTAWAFSTEREIIPDGAAGTAATNSNAQIILSTGASTEHLVVRGVGRESANTTAPVQAGWTPLDVAASVGGSGVTNIGALGLWQIASGNSYDSNPNSGGVNVDSAVVIAAFREAPAPVVRGPARHSWWT